MPPRESDAIERRVGVLLGWRCWSADRKEGLLRPIYMRGLVWKPRQPREALCPEQIHPVPTQECRCGLWAVCHPMLLNEVGWTHAPPQGIDKIPGALVVGQVALWGNIIEHERGWRAQFGYPTHLYLLADDEQLAGMLRERYVVPVVWGREADVLEQILPKDLRRAPRPRAVSVKPADVASVPITMPAIVDLIHAQERQALERARERVEVARDALRLEQQRIAAERQALELELRRREKLREQKGVSNAGAMVTLKRRLLEHGIKQADVAERAGVGREQVCNILAGRGVSRPVVEAAEQLLREKAGADPHAQKGVPAPNHSGRPRAASRDAVTQRAGGQVNRNPTRSWVNNSPEAKFETRRCGSRESHSVQRVLRERKNPTHRENTGEQRLSDGRDAHSANRYSDSDRSLSKP